MAGKYIHDHDRILYNPYCFYCYPAVKMGSQLKIQAMDTLEFSLHPFQGAFNLAPGVPKFLTVLSPT